MDQLEAICLSLCLRSAADQGQTAEDIAAEAAAECDKGVQKRDYLKIAEALKAHLKSH